MRSIVFCLLVVCLLIALGACSPDSGPAVRDVMGKSHTLRPGENKWIVINYWAPWCHSCRHEVAALNAFAREHANDVVVLGVDYDDPNDIAVLKDLVKKFSIEYPVLLHDPAKYFSLPTVAVLPTTFILQPAGEIVARLRGPQTLVSLNQQLRLARADFHA